MEENKTPEIEVTENQEPEEKRKSYFDIEIPKEEEEKAKGFFGRLKAGLGKTRKNIAYGLDVAFGDYDSIDNDFYEEVEEAMIMADIGAPATKVIVRDLHDRINDLRLKRPDQCKGLLKDCIKAHMRVEDTAYRYENEKSVLLLVGVNGTGKTTSAGKIAAKLKAQGRSVLLVAADTFRAAATQQLQMWAERAGVPIITAKEGTDPASVVFDAVAAAKARNIDVLIVDTAGRLHNKKNLMAELHKIHTILDKEYPEAYLETMVVLDGTTGQNALSQAKEFAEATDLSGIILTKLDGTAKGGIAVAIQFEMNIPVKYIGVGEGIDDLMKFDAKQFVDALFE